MWFIQSQGSRGTKARQKRQLEGEREREIGVREKLECMHAVRKGRVVEGGVCCKEVKEREKVMLLLGNSENGSSIFGSKNIDSVLVSKPGK